ncbi:hypothetical protein PIB30_088080 [Stylosanthes scabra]|uniref:Uncharacterized protein n=1 Tax=Stylosanthes scabra TaxID=79078 RepID=A0ABU6YSV1_9FABA|nr:hypothetical protein [Stylosanthes scabra]
MTGKNMEQKEQLKGILPCYMLVVQLFKERLGVHFLVSPLIVEPINVLRVTLRESKRHHGAYGANDPAYDNSGLWDVVDDWGVFGLTSRFPGRYIRNIKERNPQVYMIKRKTINGWGIERVVLGEVRPIVVRD